MKNSTFKLPEWLRGIEFISGAEGEGDQGAAGSTGDNSTDDDASGGAGSSSSSSDDASGSGDDSTDHDDDDKSSDDKAELKEALRKERAANKAKEKELKRLQRQQEDAELAKKDETEAERLRRERAEERLTKLASGYLKTRLDQAIRDAATKLNFVDVNDALAGVDREALTFEQDEDDPSDVTIDEKSVAREVKALATRKPHWVKAGTDDGEPTGSTFGGAGRRKGKGTNEETLRSKYPALNY
jgi:hypothetical protein